ncbi:hypothetical protein [Sporosarcina sp. P17b]|uniref:hypothetical protein n=1 Tax=Sporosarcina sp. P17b TaxID=2048260 RepID=UPI000C16B89F|nr:hypothetical protein [Sporosarcina sp. P17b]PIC74814.1 hypothetical protein CSV76_02900 [Sporosarcina sp. P17b]
MTDRELLELLVDKVTNIEQDFFGVKTDVSSLKTDVSSLKSDVSSLKTDVSTLKKDVSSIKEEQIFMKQAIFELDARSIVTSHKIDALTEQVSSNTTKLDDLRTTQRLVSDHDTDIRMIKKMLTQ